MEIAIIYKSAWEATKKAKWMWVLGMALALVGASGSGFGMGFYNNASSLGELQGRSDVGNAFKGTGSSAIDSIKDILSKLVSEIPTTTWLFVVLSVLVGLCVAYILKLFIKSWAQGAMVWGLDLRLFHNHNPTLRDASQYGIKNIKSVLWINFVPSIILGGIFLATGLVGIGLILIFKSTPVLIALIALLVIPIIFLIFLAKLIVAYVQIWAIRIAVLQNFNGKTAFLNGIKMLKANVPETIAVTFINSFISGGVGVAMIIIFILGIGLVGALFVLSEYLGVIGFIIIASLFFIFSMFAVLLKGIYVVFTNATWNALYLDTQNKLVVLQSPDKNGDN